MAKTLEAHDKLISEIFTHNYQFEIPDYQRPYAWTTEQAEELFNDLISAMQDARANANTSQYFLGSIVLIKNDRNPKAMVVDGQQRLTTLTILFSALRAAWAEESDSQGVSSVTPFLYDEGDMILSKPPGYRFTAREEDAEFFRQHIQERGGIEKLVLSTDKLKDSRLRYRENASLLLNSARALSANDRKQLWQFLMQSCSLVVISTPDLEAAYRIFSVLNNRGLDLAPIDIIKAEVLGSIRRNAGNEKAGAYAKKWSEIEDQLGGDAFGDLLGHIRSIYAKKKQKHTLVKEFQAYVSEYNNPIRLIDNVIIPYADVWGFIRDADFKSIQNQEIINEYLSWLNRVDFKDWVPPALVFFKRFRQQPLLLLDFFKALERLTYLLLITRAGINERIDTYAELTNQIEHDTFDGNISVLTKLHLTEKQKREFVEALDGDIYRKLPRARMALVLRLEALSSDGSKKTTFKHLSLEHVLPQTPPAYSEWIKWFPDEDEREAWTHRLANLVPLHIRKNPAASNFDFATKKDVYFPGKGEASPFILTQYVRGAKVWTPEILNERQKQLLEVLKSHWAL